MTNTREPFVTLPQDSPEPPQIVSDRPRIFRSDSSNRRKTAQTDPQLHQTAASLRDYRQAFHENPVGSNAEITRNLLGKNPRGIRYLGKNVRTNKDGELIDRWDQPIFFHQLSATLMEIRSAGPDRIMWTNDDEVVR